MDNLKESVCNALAVWIRQRPGLEYGNYGDAASYRAEIRSIARDKRDAETLLAAVRWRESITGQDIIEAAKGAYSGRMTITAHSSGKASIDYCTGQYWPTEYRRAAAAVLAGALWTYARDNMPAPSGYRVTDWSYPAKTLASCTNRESAETFLQGIGGRDAGHVAELYDGRIAGDYLRRKFRDEFGSAMQRRWFN